LIQLALDLVDRKNAMELAAGCARYVDILEAGTPLIKACGIGVVRDLEELGKPVCADLKTFDAGALEAKLAAEQGADYATVLAAASNTTISEFAKTCSMLGVKSVADMMTEPLERVKLLEKAGVSYVAVHSGLDEQRGGSSPIGSLREVRKSTSRPVIVAGGIGLEQLEAVAPHAEIIIIGSAITGVQDPLRAAAEIREKYDLLRRR